MLQCICICNILPEIMKTCFVQIKTNKTSAQEVPRT